MAMFDGERDLVLFGTSGVWGDFAGNSLTIGFKSSNNALVLLDGAT